MNADLARRRAGQQNSRTHPLRLDPSWETNPESTTLLWACQTCEGLSLPPPWLKQTNERCAAGKPMEHTGKQKLDRCWSGTMLESPFSDSALPCQPQLTETETETEKRQRQRKRERKRERENKREERKKRERKKRERKKKRKREERKRKREREKSL